MSRAAPRVWPSAFPLRTSLPNNIKAPNPRVFPHHFLGQSTGADLIDTPPPSRAHHAPVAGTGLKAASTPPRRALGIEPTGTAVPPGELPAAGDTASRHC